MDKRSTSEEQKSGYLGLTRADEERHLADVISVAQQNLERAGADIRKVNEDLADLLETYDVKDKEGLALWNNATARLKENEYDLIRYEKARKKPYFGRIDFKDGISQEEETCYIGRAGIAKNGSEPVVLDWRAPIASVYYESSMGPCTYTVSSEGTYEMDLVRKRTYEIEQDVLKDFFDSDVVANDELLTKYLAKNKKAVAIGEIGLDYHYDGYDAERQQEIFENQIKLANELSLPAVIHCRDATEDMMKILHRTTPDKFVVHCFSGSPETAKELLKLGAYISFTGVLTFKNAKKAVHSCEIIPSDRIMLETDSPYMAPVPFRGSRCDSSMTHKTAEKLAEIKGIPTEEAIRICNENAVRFFGLDIKS